MGLTDGTRVYSEDQYLALRDMGVELLSNWKLDSETYWDDAFGRVYGQGPNDGKVGSQTAPRTVILPSPEASNYSSQTMVGGIKVTQTIKVPSQTHLIGQGGLMTTINGDNMADTDDDLDRDVIHFGFDSTWNHFGTLQHFRVHGAARHCISTYKSTFGENTYWDNVVATHAANGAGYYIAGTIAFKPLFIRSINASACKYGLHLDNGNADHRSQCYIGLFSGDNNLMDSIRVDGNPGAPTTTLHIDRIKAEISNANQNENIVNLRGGAGGFCHIGSIYNDQIMASPDHTATYRGINATENSAQWRVNIDHFGRTDDRANWNDELAFDDGTVSLTWAQVNRISLDSRIRYEYNSIWSTGGQNGFDERPVVTTANLNAIGNLVNTFHKFTGKKAFNSTTSMPVYAIGPAAGDVWVDATGTTAHSPS